MSVEITTGCTVQCLKKGNKYYYDIMEDDVIFNVGQSLKSPTELSKATQIGKAIVKRITDNLTPKQLQNTDVDKEFRLIVDALEKEVAQQLIADENTAKEEAKALEEEYQEYWSNFEYHCKQYGYSRLQYIICIFEGLGVDASIEMAKAYIGYLQTFLGLKGTNVIGVGSQSSGKTHCLEHPLDCIPSQFVHRGTFTKAYFFRMYGGQDLTGHIFYLQDLGGSNDDQNTIESRDILKQLSTDGHISRGIVDEEGDGTNDVVTGFPAIAYTTVSEDIINEQERSRSIVIRPPDVNQTKLMVFDSFQEASGVKYKLKKQIEEDKQEIQGFSWWLKKNIDDVEMFNPFMFCVQKYLSQMDDFNRKIKEFNMLLKIICILNDSFKLSHTLYDDFEEDEFDITTTILIPSKQEIIDALTLFEGSTGLLPSEIALAKGILKIYKTFPKDLVDESEKEADWTYEDIIRYSAVDNDNITELTDEITGKTYLTGYTEGYVDDNGKPQYCFFTISNLKKGNSNQRWYRENRNNMSDKLYKLYNYGILIKIGYSQNGQNIYGISNNANSQINNINPKFNKKDIDMAMDLFHQRYPHLTEEFDLFVNKQKQLQVKNTNFEIKKHLYDLEWNYVKVE